MSPTQALTTLVAKYAVFDGRASRSEFWWSTAWLTGGVVVAAGLVGLAAPTLFDVALIVAVLVSFIPGLAVTVRRLHDTGRSGDWAWAQCQPFVGLVVLAFLTQPSDVGVNRYGPPPVDSRPRATRPPARRYLAAVLAAVAVPILVAFPFMAAPASDAYSSTTFALSLALGVIFGLRSMQLGVGPRLRRRAADVVIVIIGTVIVGFALLAIIMFFGLFGSYVGYYLVAAPLAVYAVLHVAIVLRRQLEPSTIALAADARARTVKEEG
jgi:uncharacterized membrane protein YhaH (DUF805 family)